MNFQATRVVDYYARLGVPANASLDEIKSAYRNLVKRYHPDVHRFDNLTIRRRVESLMRQINEAYTILSDSKTRQSYDEEYIASRIDSLASNVCIGTETEPKTGSNSDWSSITLQRLFDQIDTLQRRPLFMGVFRKVWLVPVPFCMATSVCLAFWNLGQITGSVFLGAVTAIIAYPLSLVLLLPRLIPPIRHTPLLDLKQKIVCLPFIMLSAIFAGWIWSVVVDDYGIISNRWDLCWWCGLIGITCGILAYL